MGKIDKIKLLRSFGLRLSAISNALDSVSILFPYPAADLGESVDDWRKNCDSIFIESPRINQARQEIENAILDSLISTWEKSTVQGVEYKIHSNAK